MVVSISLRAAAGLAVLMEGGNAFDAAIATALVEGLTSPAPAPGRRRLRRPLQRRGEAPLRRQRQRRRPRGDLPRALHLPWPHHHAPQRLDSASVPGAPDAYWTVHQRFGLLARLCEPAIRYAEEGLAVSPPAPHHLRLQSQAGAVRLLQRRLLPRWRAPAVGSLYRRPAYGRSSCLLAEGARTPTTGGPSPPRWCATPRSRGALQRRGLRRAPHGGLRAPAHHLPRGGGVRDGAPSQGLLVLEMLNILEGFDLAGAGFGTPEAVHLMVEAKKLGRPPALRRRPPLRGRPPAPAPGQGLRPAGGGRSTQRAAGNVAGALPETLHGDTSSFVVADGQGNAVSFIHSSPPASAAGSWRRPGSPSTTAPGGDSPWRKGTPT